MKRVQYTYTHKLVNSILHGNKVEEILPSTTVTKTVFWYYRINNYP